MGVVLGVDVGAVGLQLGVDVGAVGLLVGALDGVFVGPGVCTTLITEGSNRIVSAVVPVAVGTSVISVVTNAPSDTAVSS